MLNTISAIMFATTIDGGIHPCATALVLARVEIEVKLPDQRPLLADEVEEAHVFVPRFSLRWLDC